SGNRIFNTASQFSDVQAAQIRNQGNNFIGIAPGTFPTMPTDQVGTLGAELNPLLGPLADNGGPLIGPAGSLGSTLTRLPAAGSPLLNAGGFPEATRLATDQRGLPRPAVPGTQADIGAVEVQPGEPLPAAIPLL